MFQIEAVTLLDRQGDNLVGMPFGGLAVFVDGIHHQSIGFGLVLPLAVEHIEIILVLVHVDEIVGVEMLQLDFGYGIVILVDHIDHIQNGFAGSPYGIVGVVEINVIVGALKLSCREVGRQLCFHDILLQHIDGLSEERHTGHGQ